MESYIVRVYRRNSDSPEKINGIVEIVGRDVKRSFSTFDELRTIIDRGEASESVEKPGKRKRDG